MRSHRNLTLVEQSASLFYILIYGQSEGLKCRGHRNRVFSNVQKKVQDLLICLDCRHLFLSGMGQRHARYLMSGWGYILMTVLRWATVADNHIARFQDVFCTPELSRKYG